MSKTKVTQKVVFLCYPCECVCVCMHVHACACVCMVVVLLIKDKSHKFEGQTVWECWRKRRGGNNVNIVHIYIYITLKDEFNLKK